MHAALTAIAGRDDQLIFAQQLGIDRVFIATESWDAEHLASIRNRVLQTGLELVGFETLTLDPAPPDRDAQLDRSGRILEAAGAAGIPLISYRWNPLTEGPSSPRPLGRGEALVREEPAPPSPDSAAVESAWEQVAWFLERILPVAEEARVRLSCRTDGFPLSLPEGLGRLTSSRAASASAWHGLDLCPETLAAPLASIGELTLFTARLRNLCGETPRKRAAFLDAGEISIPRLLQKLRQAGFTGPIRAAEPPGMVEDTPWGHKGRSFDAGYLKAILQTLA